MKDATKPINNIATKLLLILALLAIVATGAFAEEKDRKPRDEGRSKDGAVSHEVRKGNGRDREERGNPQKNPEGNKSDRAYNPWGDGRFDKKPDNRTGKKPEMKQQNPNAKPGIVVRESDTWTYPDRWNNDRRDRRDRDRDYRSDRGKRDNAQVVHKVPVYKNDRYDYNRKPRYSYWGFDGYDRNYTRSVYYHYGYYPYVNRVRVRVLPYVTINYYSENINYIGSDYYLNNSNRNDLDSTLSDIRYAWIQGRDDLIDRHLRNGQMIAVLLDGAYDYSIEPDDYIQMTADAIDDIQTISFTWDSVKRRVNGEYTAFGKHTYRDMDGRSRVVYVSYTLRKISGDYIITEVGSSDRYLR